MAATIYKLCCADLNVQFVPDSYTVVEGQSAEFMLVLNRAADRAVTVSFSTMDGTAICECIR